MTVIRPNSVTGINSITVQSGNSLAVHKANGELIRTITSNSGVSTFSSISVGTATTDNSAAKSINIGLGASISQHNDNSLSFGTNGDERFQVNDNGKILIATTTTSEAHANQDELIIGSTSDDANHGITIVTPNDRYGTVAYSDGSGGTSQGLLEYNHSSDFFRIYTAASEALRIDSSGRLLIGTTTEGHSNADDLTVATSSNTGITIRSGTSNGGNIFFSDATSGTGEYAGMISYDHNDNIMTFATNDGTERLRIDSSGRLLLGLTSGRSVGDVTAQSQIEGTSFAASSLSIMANAGASAGNQAHLTLGKSRGTADGESTVVASGDGLGLIQWAGADGTDCNTVAAKIHAFVDGTPGSNDMPGRIAFYTTPDGSATPTERLRIGSAGQLGIAGANYGTAGQALLSQGASAAPQWGSVSSSSPTESYAFANLSTTSFDNSGYAVHGVASSGGSNGVTVDTTNERLTPTVAGYYYVVYSIVWSHSFSNSGLTAYNGIYKNGSQQASTTIAIYDDAGTKTNEVTALVSMNGSSDYIDFRSYQNKSGQTMSGTNLSRGFMVKLRDN